MNPLPFAWSEPVTEFIGFVAWFLANGAIGFRYAAVRHRLLARDPATNAERTVYAHATRRAATLGLVGTAMAIGLFVSRLPHLAERAHHSVGQFVTTDLQTFARCVLFLAALIGLGLATARRWAGWPIAAAGVIGAQLVGVLSGQWTTLVNPVHQLLAGLWLGTLVILVVAGIGTVLREGPPTLRGPLVADLVNGFSPLALTCGPLLVLTGVVTALRHLQPFSALWTTAYGYTLMVKLCLVAMVFGFGAWNWRRQRPRLGSEAAAGLIRRSSSLELTVATLVLMVTAVLVSLPAPKAASRRRDGPDTGRPATVLRSPTSAE